ncbi:hypothetical protein [Salinisphaera sp.]|uniref:4'-phosphopantetheinyl transferase family protein n=1 Tax=Salinisphaera sp. TaxID=1914330 RepID=UPI002D77048E|nr:hypothetical protein [Salinisphaera sp.]HET7314115.1 hypothetical protein [Salinisphaera sp.]
MLVVYIVLDDEYEDIFARHPPALAPPAYRERIATMTSRAARARTMAGLWLLEQGLAELGCREARIERLGFAPGGRPVFAVGPWFSISHSAQLVACAVSERCAVGLDVERRRNGVSARLRHAIAPNGDFFASWCAREATVKASGRVGLARIRAVAIDGDSAYLDRRGWRLTPLALAPGYAGCVAAGAAIAPGAIECIDCAARIDANSVRGNGRT